MEALEESEELESFVDDALDVPGGSALGRALAAERQHDALWRRLWGVEVAEPHPAPWIRSPTVLVEIVGPQIAAAVAGVLRDEGYQAAVCGGPGALPTGRCPLVEGRGCPLVEQADVVVHALGLSDPEGRAVLEAHRRSAPGHPIVVVTGLSGPSYTEHGAHPRGATVIDGALTRERLLDAVESAVQATAEVQRP